MPQLLNMSALFTSVLADLALRVIKDLLEKDPTLKDRTVLPVEDIILFIEFCLKNMYFSFQDQSYEQVKGVAIGSLVSPIVAKLYMEYFEQKALSTAPPGSGTGIPTTHHQCCPCHPVYSGDQQGGWVHPLLGHHCETRG